MWVCLWAKWVLGQSYPTRAAQLPISQEIPTELSVLVDTPSLCKCRPCQPGHRRWQPLVRRAEKTYFVYVKYCEKTFFSRGGHLSAYIEKYNGYHVLPQASTQNKQPHMTEPSYRHAYREQTPAYHGVLKIPPFRATSCYPKMNRRLLPYNKRGCPAW